jgi:hypothetical protein
MSQADDLDESIRTQPVDYDVPRTGNTPIRFDEGAAQSERVCSNAGNLGDGL